MLRTETLLDGRTHTYSDVGMMIRQVETGILYEDAVDTIPHTYEETEEPIPVPDTPAETGDYEAALARLGVEV